MNKKPISSKLRPPYEKSELCNKKEVLRKNLNSYEISASKILNFFKVNSLIILFLLQTYPESEDI